MARYKGVGRQIRRAAINRKVLRSVLVAGWVITTPLLALPGIFLLNTINPMVFVFQYPFEIANKSGEEIYVSPIGAIGARGYRRVLPQYGISNTAIPAFKQARFKLAPGESMEIVYDWDDINFSEILVEDNSGLYKQIIVDPSPTEGRYRAPNSDTFVIPRLSELPDAQPEVIEAALKAEYNWRVWGLICSGLLPIVLFVSWLRLRNVTSNKPLQPTGSVGG